MSGEARAIRGHSPPEGPFNRLTQATHPQPANPTESFTYDPVGNRTSSHLATAQVHDAANRLLEDSNFTYTYDENGNLTSKTAKISGEVTTYTYDAENQLIRVDKPGVVAEYRYDALGRRIGKNVNGVSTRYIYDNEDIAVEVDGTGTAQAFYLHGPGIDEPLAMARFGAGGGTVVYHADGLGSITHLTNTTGAVVRSYTYDSFGRIVTQTGTVTNPYTGRELDPESGLFYYRARYYDPLAGRFLQEDPFLGKRFLPQSINRYAYVLNRPLLLTDALGLQGIASYFLDFVLTIEKIGTRFIVAGAGISLGAVVAGSGVFLGGVLIAEAPATFGISLTALPAAAALIAAGEYLIAFGTDVYINEINGFLGTQIAGPGDISPGFPRFDPIFKESIFKKLERMLKKLEQVPGLTEVCPRP